MMGFHLNSIVGVEKYDFTGRQDMQHSQDCYLTSTELLRGIDALISDAVASFYSTHVLHCSITYSVLSGVAGPRPHA